MDRIRIPSDLNEEDVFLSLGPVKMSMRQLITVTFGFMMWLGFAKYFISPILGLSTTFALLADIWVPLAAMVLAFVKIKNRPIDVWLGHKLTYIFSARTYILRDSKTGQTVGVHTDLYSDEELETMVSQIEGPKAVSF